MRGRPRYTSDLAVTYTSDLASVYRFAMRPFGRPKTPLLAPGAQFFRRRHAAYTTSSGFEISIYERNLFQVPGTEAKQVDLGATAPVPPGALKQEKPSGNTPEGFLVLLQLTRPRGREVCARSRRRTNDAEG